MNPLFSALGRIPSPDPGSPRHRFAKAAAWFAIIFTFLPLVLTLIGVAIYNTTAFHNYVLKTAREQASEQLGVPVQVQNYALNLSNLTLDLYGVTVAGASPYANPPLLQVRHAQASVRIVSFFQRKWYLDTIRIEQPVVQVYFDKDGHSNLPTIKSSSDSKSNTSIFDLGIRHAILEGGEIFYNSRPAQLSVDLHDLDLHTVFNDSFKQYAGKLSYANGHVLYGTFQPFLHSVEIQFDATPSAFHVSSARIAGGAVQVNLNATATNYSDPTVDAQYEINVDGAQLGRLLNTPTVPTGQVRATGTAHYQALPNQAALSALVVNGDLLSTRLDVAASTIRADVSNIAAHYSLADGNATLHDFRASLLGGEVTAQGTMKEIGGNSHTEANASVRGISLAAAKGLLGKSAATPTVALTGVLNADAKATWGKTLDDLIAHADATISARAAGKSGAVPVGNQPASIPINSAIHALYTASNQQLALTQSYLRTPQTDLTMNGVVGKKSSLALHLQANDLREVAGIANLFRTPDPKAPAQPLDLSGSANFQGNVTGSTSAPHLAGQLSATNLHVNGTDWKVFRTNVDASPSRASLQNADLEPRARGRITFSASTGLTKWSFTENNPIQVELNASQLDVGDLAHLAGQQIPVTGTLNTHVSLHGTELNPIGTGKVDLTKIIAYQEPINSIDVTFDGTGTEAHANLNIDTPAGAIKGTVSVRPHEKTYTAQVTSDGIKLDRVQNLVTKNVGATGTVLIKASGQGSFDNPGLNASIQIPTLVIQKQTVENLNLQMNVADHIANATLASSAAHTSINAKARIQLTGDYAADATVDTQNIPLQPLLAVYSPEQAATFTGETELHATLHGPLKNKDLLEAHVTVPYLRMSYNNAIQLAAAAPIHVDYKNSTVTLQRSAIKGTDTDLSFEGSVPTTPNAPMSLKLNGTVNLQLAQLFSPDVRSSGELRFNINSNGTGPNIGGEIDVVDANFAEADLPVALTHGNGVLTLTSDRINIKSFKANLGGGEVTAQGGVAYRPNIQFDLGVSTQDARLLYPQGMRESINANIRLAGTTDNAVLGGTVNIGDVSFTPAFDLNNFIGQFSGVSAPPSRGITQNIALNLAVHSSNNVNLISRTLSVNGSANLQVRGTAADPVILGRVVLNNGDILINGTRFVLNGGTIQFINPSQTQPVLNLTASTTIQQYNIDLRFNGPSDQIRIQYNSDPALPQADIINLLARGQTTEAAANATPVPASQAAESFVASQVASQVSSRVSKIAGISQLSINPVLANGTSQGPPGANITIQQRVTGNLFITFSSNVASTQSQVIQGQYQVSPRVAVSATRDPNGGFAVDTIIKKSW